MAEKRKKKEIVSPLEVCKYLRELSRKYKFCLVYPNYDMEFVSYELEFTTFVFDINKVVWNLMKRERSLYEALRKIRRCNGKIENIAWVKRKIREVLFYIANSDNPHRLKWLKRIYKEQGFIAAYKKLIEYLRLEKYKPLLKIPTRYLKETSI